MNLNCSKIALFSFLPTVNALQQKVEVVNTKTSCRAIFSNIFKQKNPIAVLKAQEIASLVSIKMRRTFLLKKKKITLIIFATRKVGFQSFFISEQYNRYAN